MILRLKNVSFRVGIGHDTHRLEPGGPLRLGGVSVPHDRQAVGHSDADVLLHAVVDALLGAASMGDIGELFPDTDAAHRGRDSADNGSSRLPATARRRLSNCKRRLHRVSAAAEIGTP